jgi:hypothetical protein
MTRTAGLVVNTACAGRGPASPYGRRVRGPRTPDADRPVACWTGCHLDDGRVKGASRSYGLACGPP